MGTISGMGFAQAQVHTNHSKSAEGTSAVMYPISSNKTRGYYFFYKAFKCGYH